MKAMVGTLVLLTLGSASGCPVCDTDTGAAVRSGIFNGSFLVTLLEVLAPFPLAILLAVVINRQLPD